MAEILAPEDLEAIRLDLKKGTTIAALARAYNMSRGKMCRIAAKMGFGQSRIPPALREVIAHRYSQGESVESLADSYKVSRQTIYRILSLTGNTTITTKKEQLLEANHAEIVSRVRKGERLAEIAKSFGVTPSVITRRMKKSGLRRNKPLSELEAVFVWDAKNRKGATADQIRAALETDRSRVYRAIRRGRELCAIAQLSSEDYLKQLMQQQGIEQLPWQL